MPSQPIGEGFCDAAIGAYQLPKLGRMVSFSRDLHRREAGIRCQKHCCLSSSGVVRWMLIPLVPTMGLFLAHILV
jgi:hypothetical protein